MAGLILKFRIWWFILRCRRFERQMLLYRSEMHIGWLRALREA